MLRKLRTARTFTPGDWWLLAQAGWLLLVTDLGLRWRSFRQVQALLAVPHPPAPPANADVAIRRVMRLVDVAARYHVYPMTCLRRALVSQRLVVERGIAAELKVGVRKENGQLDAHAWLEYDGAPMGDARDVADRFAPLTAAERTYAQEPGSIENLESSA
jgi:hypothetical protein